MYRNLAHQIVVTLLPLTLAATSLPASAQEQVDDLLPNATCFVRTGTDGVVISIITPKQAASAMQAKGFTRLPCRQNFETTEQREAFRDGVCHMASTYRQDQTAAFEERYGERPEVLCGMAEVAISQWRFRDGGQAN